MTAQRRNALLKFSRRVNGRESMLFSDALRRDENLGYAHVRPRLDKRA